MSVEESDALLEVYEHDLSDKKFGDYQVIREIGSGAMSEVYLARQLSLGRMVALKVLRPELAADKNYVRRFVQEAKSAASLVHQNIVHIYEVNCFEGYWYIAQEYVQGSNLRTILQQQGPLPAQQVAIILWQVASALNRAAQVGIVHRDIKPENILVSDIGEMKVADFGLAQIISEDSERKLTLTQTGMTLGTPLYMSPEQAEGKPLDHRSDMYSLGITAYHLLTGKPPFQAETALATALQHLNKPAEPLHVLCPDIPPKLGRIVHKMIAKSPQERYQTIPGLMNDLRELYNEQGIGESRSETATFNWDHAVFPPTQVASEEATRHLERSIHQEIWVPRHWNRVVLSTLVGAFILGMIAAYTQIQAQTPKLVPPQSTTETVPHRNTIMEQWMVACRLDSEEGWLSVINYNPDQPRNIYERRAKQQLALSYMKKDEVNKAYQIFQDFVNYTPDYDVQGRAFGWAGLFWYFAKIKDKGWAMDAMNNFTMIDPPGGEHDAPTNNVSSQAWKIMKENLDKESESKVKE
ncbi:MAG: serine/threonine protein kinase [Thermoguttaceae bacterium]